MKKLWLALGTMALLAGTGAEAQTRVRGYVKKDGTYVAPHVRSNPNSTKLDNYSTEGNYNPYNGKRGTVDPLPMPKPYTLPRYVDPYAPKPYTPPCYFNCSASDD